MRNNIFSLVVFACILILTINTACASNNYNIKFSQVDKKTIAEFSLSLDSEKELEFLLPSDASRISVNIPYTKEGDYIKIKGKDIDFSYVTSEFINNVKNEYYFVHKTDIPITSNISISLVLDEGFILKPEEVFPSASKIETDGRQISVIWNFEKNAGENIPIFVTFKNPNPSIGFFSYFAYFIVFLIIFYLGKITYNRFIKNKKKTKEKETEKKEKPKVIVRKVVKVIKQTAKETKEEKQKKELEEIERHLLDEERKILEELRKADRNEMWQRQLQLNLGLSKAKASRLIRNLESRHLIKKIPFGNTNKIVLA